MSIQLLRLTASILVEGDKFRPGSIITANATMAESLLTREKAEPVTVIDGHISNLAPYSDYEDLAEIEVQEPVDLPSSVILLP